MESPWRETLRRARKHRAPALAAEVAYFGLLSIPALLVGVVATAGLVARFMGPETVSNVTDSLIETSGHFFSADVTTRLVRPAVNDVLTHTRFGALSLGYALAIWSGSRMINALYQGVEILSEQDAQRSSVQTRVRAIKTLLLGFIAVTLALPLMLAGPRLVANFLPWYLGLVAWLVVGAVAAVAIAWVMRQAIPETPTWGLALKAGGAIALAWAIVSVFLQWWLSRSTSQPGIYGPLAAPIALLIWMQALALIFLFTATRLSTTPHEV